MANELHQAVAEAITKPISVGSVAVGSIGAGVGAYVEVLSPVVGLMAAFAGLMLSVMLAIKTYYGIQLARAALEKIEED